MLANTGLAPMQTWCGGRLHTGSRPLAPAERAQLQRAGAGWRRLLARAGAAYAAVWLVTFPIMMVLRERQSMVAVLLMYVLAATVIPGLPVLLWALVPKLRRWHEASGDLAAGAAECFALPQGARDEDAMGREELVLASRSHRVLAGPPGLLGERLQPRQVPATDPRDFWIPIDSAAPSADLDRRRMHEAETHELREAIRLAHLADRPTVFAIVLLVVIALLWSTRGPHTTRLVPNVFALLNSALALRTLWHKGVDVFRATQLARDLRDGVVLRLVPRAEGHAPTEFLPHSKLVWRRGVVPADWRGWPAPATDDEPRERRAA